MKTFRPFLTPVLIFIVALLIQYGIPSFFSLNQNWQYALGKLGGILLITSIAWALIALLRFGKKQVVQHYDTALEDNLEARKRYTKYTVLENIIIFFDCVNRPGLFAHAI